VAVAQTVTGLVRCLVEAWNARAAETFGSLFTAHANYVGADGVRRQGRGAIEERPDREARRPGGLRLRARRA